MTATPRMDQITALLDDIMVVLLSDIQWMCDRVGQHVTREEAMRILVNVGTRALFKIETKDELNDGQK